MDAISASVGRRLVGLYVEMLMKRMSILLGWCFAVTAILSNGPEANRHETERFLSVRTTIELQSSGIQRETARATSAEGCDYSSRGDWTPLERFMEGTRALVLWSPISDVLRWNITMKTGNR
jgi:hypothetical protein